MSGEAPIASTSTADASPRPRKRIRIAHRETIKDVVAQALRHFHEPGAPPLVLHTIPSELTAASAASSTRSLNRLVSVTEVIKREWTRARQSATRREGDAAEPGRGKAERTGDRLPTRLHQYNELVCLERLIEEERAEDASSMQARHDEVIMAVTEPGRKRAKKTHSAAMVITLALRPLDAAELVGKSITHQAPPPKVAMRGRTRKRKRKREAAAKAAAAAGAMDTDDQA